MNEFKNGYDEQLTWLQLTRPALLQARDTLASRVTTLEDNVFNAGAAKAMQDYIAALDQS